MRIISLRLLAILTLLLIIAPGCSSTASIKPVVNNIQRLSPNNSYQVSLPWEGKVTFSGLMDPANVDPKSHQLYYDGSAGAGGVAAQILTHALLANSAKNSLYTKAQAAADEVLLPYVNQLEGYTYDNLWSNSMQSEPSAFTKFTRYRDESGVDMLNIVELTPAFALTQDKKALVLVNKVKAFSNTTPEVTAYYNEIMVVSDPVQSDDANSYWENSNTPLQAMAESLFADSIELLQKSMHGSLNPASKQETITYWLGGIKQFERANLVENSCARQVIKNLRGFLMSVPKAIKPSFDSDTNNSSDC